MNFALHSLYLGSVLSASPVLNSVAKYSVSECSLSRANSPLLYTRFSVYCYKAKLGNVLGSAIFLGSSVTSFYEFSSTCFPSDSQSNFYECLFHNITGTAGSSSAIYCSSGYSIRLDRCQFVSCTITGNPGAGAIASNGNLTVLGCCLSNCYKNYEGNDCFTNAIYGTGSLFVLNNSVILLCGVNNSSGDSTLFVTKCVLTVSKDNFTQCFGYGGGASGRYEQPLSNPLYQYLNIYECGQMGSVEVVSPPSSINLNYWNILNNTFDGCLMDLYACSAVITGCVFIGNPTFGTPFSGYTSISFVNCVADKSLSSMTYNPSVTAISLNCGYLRGCNYVTVPFSNAPCSPLCRGFVAYSLGLILFEQ